MTLSLKRTLTLLLLICVVSGAFFVGRTLGASSQSSRVNNVVYARRDAVNASDLTVSTPHAQDPPSNVPPADVFEEVLSNIQRNFVEINDIPLSKIDADAITRMYASLGDPRTRALGVERRRARQSALQGKYYGAGANLAVTRTKKADVDYSHLTVVSVMPGSPAEKAGLRSGDYITELDGRWIINYTIYADADRISHEKYKDDTARNQEVEQVRQKFKAGVSLARTLDDLELGEGKPHTLTVDRQGQTLPQKLSLTTALTRVEPVEYKTLGSVGYLRVRQFNPDAAEAFETALDKATSAKERLKGLIVDLRQNPGGVTADAQTGVDGYGAARKLIARLTSGGAIAAIERKPKHRETLTVTPARANPENAACRPGGRRHGQPCRTRGVRAAGRGQGQNRRIAYVWRRRAAAVCPAQKRHGRGDHDRAPVYTGRHRPGARPEPGRAGSERHGHRERERHGFAARPRASGRVVRDSEKGVFAG